MAQQKVTDTDMIASIQLTPQIFTEEGALESVLNVIDETVRQLEADTSTNEGRKKISSNAWRIARSKTFLDDLGKKMVTTWKQKAKKVDSKRKHLRDHLDKLKASYRQPLTDWEVADKKRIEAIQERMDWLKSMATDHRHKGIDKIERMIQEVTGAEILEATYEEYTSEAMAARENALLWLKKSLEQARQIEKEKVELERLRKEAKVREAQLKKEERAKREAQIAEQAAKEARIKAEQEKQAEIARLKAEQERKEQAAEEARIKAAQEKQAEIDRLKAEQERKVLENEMRAEAERKRREDISNRQKVKSRIVDSFCRYGVGKDIATILVNAISEGKIAELSINY